MQSYHKELWFAIATRRAFVNITPDVEACLGAGGIKRRGLHLGEAQSRHAGSDAVTKWETRQGKLQPGEQRINARRAAWHIPQ